MNSFKATLCAAVLSLSLTACQDEIPTVAQIELYIPAEMRSCPYAPPSPGRGASEKARAQYITGLYYAWRRCYNNNEAIDALYQKYRERIDRAATE